MKDEENRYCVQSIVHDVAAMWKTLEYIPLATEKLLKNYIFKRQWYKFFWPLVFMNQTRMGLEVLSLSDLEFSLKFTEIFEEENVSAVSEMALILL